MLNFDVVLLEEKVVGQMVQHHRIGRIDWIGLEGYKRHLLSLNESLAEYDSASGEDFKELSQEEVKGKTKLTYKKHKCRFCDKTFVNKCAKLVMNTRNYLSGSVRVNRTAHTLSLAKTRDSRIPLLSCVCWATVGARTATEHSGDDKQDQHINFCWR